MNLTEGQLFTIEAINRIDGFVWPDGAEFAALDRDDVYINFFQNGALPYDDEAWIGKRLVNSSVNVGAARIDWRNSLITREQFDNVDGWVRNDGKSHGGYSAVDIMFDSGEVSASAFAGDYDWAFDDIKRWRYHKPAKKTEMQPEAPKQPSIDELYSQYKTQRDIVESAKKTLADEMEAEDKLLEQIKAWNLEHGFDVQLLDESEEKPDLVITDWRDLQVGDVIEAVSNGNIGCWPGGWASENIGKEFAVFDVRDGRISVDCNNPMNPKRATDRGIKFKFIRRP
ncbi:MAG: hypothetical protein ACRDC6_23020 [Shewanella sp.]